MNEIIRARSDSLTLRWERRFLDTAGFIWKPESRTYSTLDEESVSVNHYPLDVQTDDGGAFLLSRSKDEYRVGQASLNPYRGDFTIGNPAGTFTNLTVPTRDSDASLDSRGVTAVAQVEPTNPAFSAPVAFGELFREGLPSLLGLQTMKNRAHVARSAGGEYLNVQFGWLPLVSEVRKLYKAVDKSEQILASYHKGAGTKQRRRFLFPTERDTKVYQGAFYPLPTELNTFLQGSMSETKTTEYWFSGAFKYHLPVPDDTVGKIQAWASDARKVSGIEITPEVLWNLSPWTWAIDWFTNIGDIAHNISAMGRDGLVMQYGYMMRRSKRQSYASATLTNKDGSLSSVGRVRENVYLQRRPATPFGFGVDLAGITPQQSAILLALGLSRT